MDYFNFGTTTESINSKAACDFLAQRLRELANDFEARSTHLKNTRSNLFQIDDKSPALHVANQAFNGWKSGACPATICRNLAARYFVDSEICHALFERKRRAHNRAETKKRNQLIVKWDYDGLPSTEIVARTGLSKGQVSKIISRGF